MNRVRFDTEQMRDAFRVFEGLWPDMGTRARAMRDRLARLVQASILHVPSSREPLHANPQARSQEIIQAASVKAATVSGSLALPPGPLGLVTLLPDLVMVWRIQAQMVADVAGAFGQRAALNREHLTWCLFKHAASQVVRDVAVRVGNRVILRQAPNRLLGRVLQRVSMPVVGTVAVAAYTFADTRSVGRAATELFSHLGNCKNDSKSATS
jgi:uncharacterized protein (DUF697 family)